MQRLSREYRFRWEVGGALWDCGTPEMERDSPKMLKVRRDSTPNAKLLDLGVTLALNPKG